MNAGGLRPAKEWPKPFKATQKTPVLNTFGVQKKIVDKTLRGFTIKSANHPSTL